MIHSLCTYQFIRAQVPDKTSRLFASGLQTRSTRQTTLFDTKSWGLYETGPLDTAHLHRSSPRLWHVAVLFILAIHGCASIW
jgi:hypothetical protein